MIRKKILLFATISALGLSSCSDYLDPQELSIIKEGDIYKNMTYIQQMWVNSYSYLPGGFNSVGGSMLCAATDESEAVNGTEDIQRFNNGAWYASDMPDNRWDNYYKGIRQCCEIIENLPNVTWEEYMESDPLTYQDRMAKMEAYINEARFLRAYYYFELVKRYGAVPLVEKKIYLDDDSDLYFVTHVKRNTFEECINYIASECDAVVPNLPLSYDDSWLGRATRGAALALKSKALLFAASDLYNQAGNENPYIGYTSGNQSDRWLVAAQAANDVIELGKYSLHSSYQDLFTLTTNSQSNETIFERRLSGTLDIEKNYYSIGFNGGKTGTCPTQNLVDDYEMIDGTLFDWTNPLQASDPYSNRDPRLKQTILTNNDVWCGRNMEMWQGGLDGAPRYYATKTGYYLKKYLHDNVNLVASDLSYTRQWFFMRYAEVLLNYAEAANQYGGPTYTVSGGTLSAKDALDLIRKRAGMPITDVTFSTRGVFLNKTNFNEFVLHERRIELAFEDQRWWDTRRTMQGETALGGTIHKVNITKNGSTFTYSTAKLEDRVFDKNKMYFYPIPQSEIAKSKGNLVQNPNW